MLVRLSAAFASRSVLLVETKAIRQESGNIQSTFARSHLKKVFSSDIGVEASSQVLDILEYACGLILGLALISTENPNFEMGSIHTISSRDLCLIT